MDICSDIFANPQKCHGKRTHLEEVSAAGVLLEDGDHVGVVEERGRARSVVVHAARFVGQVTQRRTGVKIINLINLITYG